MRQEMTRQWFSAGASPQVFLKLTWIWSQRLMPTAVLPWLDMTHLTHRRVTTTTVGVHEPSISSSVIVNYGLCIMHYALCIIF